MIFHLWSFVAFHLQISLSQFIIHTMPSMNSLTVTLLLMSFRALCTEASVHEYAGEKFSKKGNAFVVHGGSEGIYYSHPNLSESSVSPNRDAYIRFERIVFRRPQVPSNFRTGLIYAVLFEVDDRDTIGGSLYGGQRSICCSTDLAKSGVCKKGELIQRQSIKNPGWPKVFSVSFDINEETSIMQSRSIQITKTGMYNLYFMHCEPNLSDMIIEGKTVWKNHSGYLPGQMAPLLSLYGFMSLSFLLLAIFWFFQYARFWKEVLPLQNCITLVITLGMLETALWYFDYAEFNKNAVRPIGTTVWAVTFGTVKRTFSRMIILIVSMGYGVVRPTLGGLTSKVIMLGTTFFIASEVFELVEHVGVISDLVGKGMFIVSFSVAILDAFFLVWIFTSLSATLNELQAKPMMGKLDIYRKFTNALVVAVIVSLGWICHEFSFKSTDIYNEQWQKAWISQAFWQVLSFSLLCIICVLWAPSQNSMRYAYSDDVSQEFDDDDISMLMKPSILPIKYIHKK